MLPRMQIYHVQRKKDGWTALRQRQQTAIRKKSQQLICRDYSRCTVDLAKAAKIEWPHVFSVTFNETAINPNNGRAFAL